MTVAKKDSEIYVLTVLLNLLAVNCGHLARTTNESSTCGHASTLQFQREDLCQRYVAYKNNCAAPQITMTTKLFLTEIFYVLPNAHVGIARKKLP